MIVISDTGPLNYLTLMGAVDILSSLYGSVVIPEAVRQELLHPDTPEIVRTWAAHLSAWVIVRQPRSFLPLSLDIGELTAISLAVEIGADLVLMDERRGRRATQAQGLDVIGTLGTLATASRAGLLDFDEAVIRLGQTNFHITQELIQAARERGPSE